MGKERFIPNDMEALNINIYFFLCGVSEDSHPQVNLWDPYHKAGQLYRETSGMEAEQEIALEAPL